MWGSMYTQDIKRLRKAVGKSCMLRKIFLSWKYLHTLSYLKVVFSPRKSFLPFSAKIWIVTFTAFPEYLTNMKSTYNDDLGNMNTERKPTHFSEDDFSFLLLTCDKARLEPRIINLVIYSAHLRLPRIHISKWTFPIKANFSCAEEVKNYLLRLDTGNCCCFSPRF